MHWLCVSAAYPWYTSVRKTLEDPAYADWYIKFKPVGPYYSNKVWLSCGGTRCTCWYRGHGLTRPPTRACAQCDNNYDPPLCSDYYHNQEQSVRVSKGSREMTLRGKQ